MVQKLLNILLILVFLALLGFVIHAASIDKTKPVDNILRVNLCKDYEYIFFEIPSFQDSRNVLVDPKDIHRIIYVYSLKRAKLMKFVKANECDWKPRKIIGRERQ